MITVSMTRNWSNANWSWRSTPSFGGRTTVPCWGVSSPVSSFMNVDLPAPFGPVKPYRRAAENVVVTSSKRTFDPYRIETPETEIMSDPEGFPALRRSAEATRHGGVDSTGEKQLL